jgi:ribosomal protein S18 acetylase RimI-like enzyme
MTAVASLQHDTFASGLLEREVYALSLREYGSRLMEALPGIVDACREKRGVMICTKVPTDQVAAVSYLERLGFGVVETLMTLTKEFVGAGTPTTGVEVGFAEPEDEAGVRALAGSSFRYSRFHMDPQVENAMADRFKEAWAGNFFCGKRGDYMVVARAEGEVAGFLQLLKRDNVLMVDLIAVGEGFRRRGIAAGMMDYAQQKVKGVRFMQVGTQVANMGALACYQKAGFTALASTYALHYHNS